MPAMRVRQAIATAIADEMRTDPTVIVFGEDIAEAEGPFKTGRVWASSRARYPYL